jgi:hypothetical protein
MTMTMMTVWDLDNFIQLRNVRRGLKSQQSAIVARQRRALANYRKQIIPNIISPTPQGSKIR